MDGPVTDRDARLCPFHSKIIFPLLFVYAVVDLHGEKVGIVENYTVDDWKADIAQAQAIGIDGFALNCAPERIDDYTPKQLANAYQAAEELGFKMFISFDFAYWSTGDTAEITDIVGNYSSHPAQAYYRFVVLAPAFALFELSN